MKSLQLKTSRIEKTLVCFFYVRLSANLEGNPEGHIMVANSNAGASLNQVEIKIEDIFTLLKGEGSSPDVIVIPSHYIDKCEFSYF